MDDQRGNPAREDGQEDVRDTYMRRFGLWVLVALALVFLVVAYSMVYDSLVGRVTPTITVKEGTLDSYAQCQAIIVRDERLIRAAAPGIFHPVASEGERLAKGGVAARIGGSAEPEGQEPGGDDESANALLLLERAEGELNDARLYLSSKEMELAIYLNRGESKSASRLEAEVADAKLRVESLIKARQDAHIAYELSLKASQVSASSQSSQDPGGIKVRTSRQAIASFSWDGLENRLSPSNPEILDTDYSIAAEAGSGARALGDQLSEGDIVFREIGSLSTDLLLFIKGVDPESLRAGRSYRIRFPRLSSEKVAAILKSSKEKDGGSVTAYFSLDRYVNSMTSLRTVEAELLTASYTGLIVPARAIGSDSGRPYVYVMRQDRFVKAYVEVLGTVAGEAAVSSEALKPGDKVKFDG